MPRIFISSDAFESITKQINILNTYFTSFTLINMNTKRGFILILCSLLFFGSAFSQGEIDNEQKIFFRNEKSWAIFLNSNGFGANFRKGTRLNSFRKFIWEIDMNYVKHPKETKISNSYAQLNQYVYGKTNFAWETRGAVGFQREIFRKIDKTGVAIRYFYDAGPSLMLLKPIYYQVAVGNGVEDQKFNLYTAQYIYGRSSFLKGINEIKVDPGVYLKGGISFEYSKQDARLQALEVGGVASAFLNEVDLMASHNTRFLFSLFISFRWGRIISGGYMEGVDNDEDKGM
jgi:hypothetical protein